MDVQAIRSHCLSLPHATEHVQWGNDLVFKIAGKMFAVTSLEPSQYLVSFKCTAGDFSELLEEPGFAPAPYMARAKWVALESAHTIPRARLTALLTKAHATVLQGLPKKTQAALARGT